MNNEKPLARADIWAALLSVYIIWGSTYLAIRFAVETMPPFLFAGVRFLIGGAVLYGVRRLRGDAHPARIQWRSAAIVGLFLLVGGNGSVVWAEQRVPSGLAALLVSTAPLWIVLFDWLRPLQRLAGRAGGQPPQPRAVLGVVIGFLGVLVLMGGSGLSGMGGIDAAGMLVITFAAMSWAAGSLYGRSAPLPASPLLGTGMEMLAGGMGLLILGTISGEWARLDLAAISTRSLLAMAYLIVFGGWVGFTCYAWLLRNAPTPLVSTHSYVNPIVAILLGSLLANEPITPRIVLAAGVILAAVLLTTTAPQPRPATPATAAADAATGGD